MATVVSDNSSDACQSLWLVNAAFLQEIKDSNPNLWHQFHDLRTICQLESGRLRDAPIDYPDDSRGVLTSCETSSLFSSALEESYGLISSPQSGFTSACKKLADAGRLKRHGPRPVRFSNARR